MFTQKIQFKIPVSELSGKQDDVDVFRFEPERGVYLKLPSNIDNTNKKFQFQTDVGGIYVFSERKSAVCFSKCD